MYRLIVGAAGFELLASFYSAKYPSPESPHGRGNAPDRSLLQLFDNLIRLTLLSCEFYVGP